MSKRTLFCLIALCFFIACASAENGSYVIVEPAETPDYAHQVLMPKPNEVYRIYQGQSVYLNDTIDVSGMGHGCDFAWYGKYEQYDDPQYIRHTDGSRKDLMNFYIDPEVFASRPGMWFQYYGNITEESHGNLDAFYVIAAYRNYTETLKNGTTLYKSEIVSNKSESIKVTPEKILPDVKVSDYLVALGDSIDTGFGNVWVFGRVDGLYAHDGLLSKDDVYSLETGSYSLVSHSAGSNTVFDVGYNSDKSEFWKISYTGNVPSITTKSTSGSQPRLDKDILKTLVSTTDDTITEYTMEVQEPSISIVRIDEISFANQILVKYENGMTVLDIRGYTNVANGTGIKFVVDPDKKTPSELAKTTFTAITMGDISGNIRVYRVYVPINKDIMPNGVHTIKGWIDNRCEVYSDFVVSEMPPDSFVPNASLKYIGDRNPWAPNLTVQPPQIIEKVVTQVVTVEVTPSDEVVYAQQLKAKEEIDARNWENMKGIAGMVFAGIAILAGLGYVATVVWRGRD